jgi:hypothetical protein
MGASNHNHVLYDLDGGTGFVAASAFARIGMGLTLRIKIALRTWDATR